VKIILIDTREQQGDYIKARFDSIGINSEIATLPYSTGADYLISGEYGTVAVQRKDSMAEVVVQLDDLQHDILPRLISFTSNIGADPILLIEESHIIGSGGYLFGKRDKVWIESGMRASSYYGFVSTVKKMGVDVVTVRKSTAAIPDETVWYLASLDGYLQKQHYPKQIKTFKPEQQALGMLCCIPGIGEVRARKALEEYSIAELVTARDVKGLTDKQLLKVQKVLKWHTQ